MLTAANIKATARTLRDMPSADVAVVGSESAAAIVKAAAASIGREVSIIIDSAFAPNHLLVYQGGDETKLEQASEALFRNTDEEETLDMPPDIWEDTMEKYRDG